MVAGARAYERGEYLAAHELWEEPFRRARDPSNRLFYQALAQLGAAAHKLHTGQSLRGAERILDRAIEKVSALEDGPHGMRLDALLDHLSALRAHCARMRRGEDGSSEAAPPPLPMPWSHGAKASSDDP